ncbi:AAA family ATPase [Bacillus thuringiensis]|uniref:AAA family ATPase n=1 Tax=Bacillus thuringiensis TaxID=1428 RepID=UPI002FBD6948
MSFKLKGIELDAFRIYEDKQLFNFLTKSGEVANLIVVYAPNGYGKTSFIDAVEWGLTGSINRISKSSIAKNTAEAEKGLILKNRKSPGKCGKVTLIAENGGVLVKQTKVIGKNGRKTDYAEGDIVAKSDVFNDIEFHDFATKSILGQDKIDSFLRSFSPKDRYDILTNFWDSANDSELFKMILSMNSELEKQIVQVKEQFNKIDAEIKNLTIRPEIILEINNLVNKFNQIKLKNLTLPKLNRENNIEFVKELIKMNSKIGVVNRENEDKFLISSYLVDNNTLYASKISERNNIKKSIKESNDILKKFNKREDLIEDLNIVVYESYDVYMKYKHLKSLKNEYNEYEQILKQIKDYEELNLRLNKELSNLNIIKTKEEQELQGILFKLESTQKSKIEVESNYSKLDSNLEKYNIIENKKIHLNKRLKQLQKLIDVRWNKKNELHKKLLTLESYSKYTTQNIIKVESNNEQIKTIISKLKNSLQFKTYKEYELKKLNQDYIQFGKLNEQLNTIYKVGKTFIEESLANSCPLCHREYEDFQTLIDNVNSQFLEVESLDIFKENIEIVKNELSKEEEKIDYYGTLFRKEIDKEITVLSKKAIENEAKITSYNSLNQKLKIKVEDLKREEDSLTNFFEQFDIDIKNINPTNLTNIKSFIIENIKRLDDLINGLVQEKNNKNETIKVLSEKQNKKEAEIVSNKNKIRELSECSVLKRVNQLIEKCKVGNNINIIKNEFEVFKQKFLLTMDKKRVINEQITQLNQDLETINRKELLDVLDSNQKDYEKLHEYINDYKEKTNSLLECNSYLEEDILLIHNKLRNEKLLIKEGTATLNRLKEFTKYVEDNIATKTKQSKKKELEQQLEILEKGKEELLSAKKYSIEYIDNKIKNAFNVDAINSIYQRIDPHPDFNNIKFEADLRKDKPELHIYASSGQEKLAPILYFSAAQVNVLSLSIFLAKALIEEQEGLNTIFMDDPIQHLDNLNILSFIDLLRTITVNLNKQVIISTHNENFFKLIKRKMDPSFTSSKFIELESFGKIKK